MKIRNSLIFFCAVFILFITVGPQGLMMPSATDTSAEDTSTDAADTTDSATLPTTQAVTTPAAAMPSATDTSSEEAPKAAQPDSPPAPAVEPTQFKTIDLEGISGKPLTSNAIDPKDLQDLSNKANELQAAMQTILNNLEKTRSTCQETFHTVASPLDTLLPEVSSLLGKYGKQVPSSNP